MNCPHCHETLPSLSCRECGEEVPEKSLYCCWCGKPLAREKVGEVDDSERIPCSDGNCIGTVNEKGVCNICGKSYSGEAKPSSEAGGSV